MGVLSALTDSPVDKDQVRAEIAPLFANDSAIDRFLEADNVTAYKGRHAGGNIVIGVPGYYEWLVFYDDTPAGMTRSASVAAYRRWTATTAQQAAHILDGVFFTTLSGAALYKEIGRAQDKILTIHPIYDRTVELDSDVTYVTNVRDKDNARNGVGADTSIFVGELLLPAKGITAQLSSSILAGFPRDEIIFHELVHAAAMMNGKDVNRDTLKGNKHGADSYGVDNVAEFLAVQIANIYRQEKKREALRFNHDNDEYRTKNVLDAFPDMSPTPREIVKRFRQLQHIFFEGLADVPRGKAKVNLMKQYRDELNGRR